MIIKTYGQKLSSQVVCGMIKDSTVCARIAAVWEKPGLFDNDNLNVIAGWCVKYVREFGKAPGEKQIDILFDQWAESKAVSEEKSRMMDRTLTGLGRLSNREINPDYLLKVAEGIINKVRLKRAWERAEFEMDGSGDVNKSLEIMQGLGKVDLFNSIVKPGQDFAPWVDAFDRSMDRPLFSYPGELNEFIGSAMTPDSLIGFMAPDKSFKSVLLLDAVFRAVKARRNTVLFEAGDLSQRQVMRRIAVRAARRPYKPGPYSVPRRVSSMGRVSAERRQAEGFLRAGEAYRAFQGRYGTRDNFRLSCHSNSSLSVVGIQGILSGWAREGWKPSVIVIDYADILAAPVGMRETNDQIDENWKQLRRLSQEWNALVLTATQSNAEAYKEKSPVLRKKHFSGRKTKLAHVSGMIGINVNEEFREKGVIGLNWIVRRDGSYTESELMIVAGCIPIMNPIMKVAE